MSGQALQRDIFSIGGKRTHPGTFRVDHFFSSPLQGGDESSMQAKEMTGSLTRRSCKLNFQYLLKIEKDA
jgi:hypothetical protein